MGYPSLVFKNQFGEQSNARLISGSSQLYAQFNVEVANVGGNGINSLVGTGIKNVFMHSTSAFTGTSHTSTLIDSISSTANLVVGMPVQGSGIPAGTTIATIASATSITLSAATSSSTTGSITYQGVGSPNPAAGYIYVQLTNNYSAFVRGSFMVTAPKSGSDVNITSGLTANAVYQITAVGTSSAANWQFVGLPAGITPAVGAVFVASTSSAGTGTGTVQLISAAGSTIDHLEFVGNPNVSCNPSDNSGAELFLVSLGATSSSVTTFIAKAPADNTGITIMLNMVPVAGPLI